MTQQTHLQHLSDEELVEEVALRRRIREEAREHELKQRKERSTALEELKRKEEERIRELEGEDTQQEQQQTQQAIALSPQQHAQLEELARQAKSDEDLPPAPSGWKWEWRSAAKKYMGIQIVEKPHLVKK